MAVYVPLCMRVRILPSRARLLQAQRSASLTTTMERTMKELLRRMWLEDEGEDIAEYAVMLAVILVIVVGTVRLIGTQANNVFSETASAIGG
jgi:Flp pilus assembly pilin Flp